MKSTAATTGAPPAESAPAAHHEFEELIGQLFALQQYLLRCWERVAPNLKDLDRETKISARNLVYYAALRRNDIRTLQNALAQHGISSLGRSESHVMTNVNKVLRLLHRIVQRRFHPPAEYENELSFDKSKLILKQRTDRLLGREPEDRKVRIMVTLPSEAAENYALVRELLANGMDCARINCAHDSAREWEKMIENVRRAEKETGRACRVCIDIAGPKLRTGAIEDGPRVLRLRPVRDVFGRPTEPAEIWLTPLENPPAAAETIAGKARLEFPGEFFAKIKTGQKIRFRDARGARRKLIVKEKTGGSFRAECRKTAYITPETRFRTGRRPKIAGRAENIPPLAQFILLQKGDKLILTGERTPGRPATATAENEPLPARLPCTLPEVFDDLKPGENIWFDDGKIGGIIKSATTDEVLVEITHSGGGSQKLRADKGINLPDSDLRLPALTAKDTEDLKFVVRHADLVGYSFVRRAADVVALQNKLRELNGEHLGIILKIETRHAFEQLPEILLTALRSPAVGVMIARGDLAIETGFERLAEVQEEILWMSEAAHLPVIWATQVLERLSKDGVYSRAEITDAAMSERAECVMLNKGAFVGEAVCSLNDILIRMQCHVDKKRPLLRRLRLADRFFDVFKNDIPPANGNKTASRRR